MGFINIVLKYIPLKYLTPNISLKMFSRKDLRENIKSTYVYISYYQNLRYFSPLLYLKPP